MIKAEDIEKALIWCQEVQTLASFGEDIKRETLLIRADHLQKLFDDLPLPGLELYRPAVQQMWDNFRERPWHKNLVQDLKKSTMDLIARCHAIMAAELTPQAFPAEEILVWIRSAKKLADEMKTAKKRNKQHQVDFTKLMQEIPGSLLNQKNFIQVLRAGFDVFRQHKDAFIDEHLYQSIVEAAAILEMEVNIWLERLANDAFSPLVVSKLSITLTIYEDE